MNLPEKVKKKLRDLPDEPGCYMMRDRRGRIIYVGKASSLRKRVAWYFRQATLRSGSPKLRGLVRSIHDIDYIVAKNEAEAILTEGRLIKDYRPHYNVSFKDDKRFLLLRADPRQRFPRFQLCRINRGGKAVYLGPFASAGAARATLDFVEKRFGLRKCTPRLPNRETYKHCINDIVRYCSAPCIGRVTEAAYRERFDEACAFLRGERLEYLKELGAQMEQASEQMDFERAAHLRDTLLQLHATVSQGARATTPEMQRRDARAAVQALKTALGLRKTPRAMEAYDVSNISGTYSVAGMVYFEDGMPQRHRYRRFRIKTVEGSNDPAMMAEVIRRRFARLDEEGTSAPGLVLVDGGIAQVRAARAQLKELGLGRVPVAGLAKRFEEITWKDGGPPLRLPRSSPALKVLQRVRDEAHRFALTYHRHLRSRRIKESMLDEIPGIGAKRKHALLKHFGSVRRLMRASEEQIAAVPGFGGEMARLIRESLAAGQG